MAISSSETARRFIMGKNAVSLKITIVLVFYILLSIYWANRLANETRSNKPFKSSPSNQTFMRTNFTWHIPNSNNNSRKTNLPVDEKLVFERLGKLLQFASTNLENLTMEYYSHVIPNSSVGSNMLQLGRLSSSKGIYVDNSHHSNTCKALVSGDDALRLKTIRMIKQKRKANEPKSRSDDVIAGLFSKCKSIVEFLRPPYLHNASNQRQQIAFSILLSRPADQTLQLLRAIYDPSNLYCLHVDLHATKKYFTIIKKISNCLENVVLAPKRFEIAYPTVNRINAHLSCFKRLLNSSVQWRYLISLSGSVFPLRNVTILSDYFSKRDHVNGIASRRTNNPRFLRRVKFVHEFKRGLGNTRNFLRTKKRKAQPPGNITLFRSENNFFVTRGFVEFAISSRESKELLQWSQDTRNPDEFFWATLDHMPGAPGGSPHRNDIEIFKKRELTPDGEDINKVQDNDLVARLWKGTRGVKCGGTFHGNLCVFNYMDLRWLLTHDNLFAGPFDMGVDRIVLECLYQNLRKPLVEDFT